jgi:DNA-binding GntR family transcriptional regulator
MSTSTAQTVSPIRPRSDAHRAYHRLKQMIVTLELRPGTTVHEGILQRDLGIGRTPLREALQRLSNDGLLQIYPRRAIVVAQLGVPEIHQMFETRLVLEPSVAALAARKITAAELERIRALGSLLTNDREQTNALQFLSDDHTFHRTISECTHNDYLIGCVDHILTLNQWLWHIYFDARGTERNAMFEHDRIVDALFNHDAEAAEVCMRRHILRAKEHLLAGL